MSAEDSKFDRLNAYDGYPPLEFDMNLLNGFQSTYILLDAPSLLQRGLPRALPGLEEMTVESVKEGTRYQNGEFQDPPQVLQGRSA